MAGKTGLFYPSDPRRQVEVDQWLMWQMGAVGPMAGQAHHFIRYAPETIRYARKRYVDEVNRLYGVLDRRLDGRKFVAHDYSIADMAIWPWARGWEGQEQDIREFPNMAAWLERVGARPGVVRGAALGRDRRRDLSGNHGASGVLFGQRATR